MNNIWFCLCKRGQSGEDTPRIISSEYVYYEFTWNYKAIISLDNYSILKSSASFSFSCQELDFYAHISWYLPGSVHFCIISKLLYSEYSAPQLNSSVIRIDLKTIATYFWGAGHVCMKSRYIHFQGFKSTYCL